jgi:hypothetical protein
VIVNWCWLKPAILIVAGWQRKDRCSKVATGIEPEWPRDIPGAVIRAQKKLAPEDELRVV